LLLLVQSPRVTPLNSFAGYLFNAFLILLLWQTSLRQSFACQVSAEEPQQEQQLMHTHNHTVDLGQHPHAQETSFLYTNPLAFPALDASLLAHMAAEVWDRWRDILQARHAVFLSSALMVALGSMLWFHAWWHVLLSLFLGVIVYLAWRLLLRRYRRHIPQVCRPPPTAVFDGQHRHNSSDGNDNGGDANHLSLSLSNSELEENGGHTV